MRGGHMYLKLPVVEAGIHAGMGLSLGAPPAPPDPDIVVREDDDEGTIITHNAAASSTRLFGAQEITAGATATITIAVQNTGPDPLEVSVALGGTDPTQFVLDTTGFTSPIASGAFDTFTVSFDPSTVGAKTATILITHDDGEVTSPFIINMSGTGSDLLSADVVADALAAWVAHDDYITIATGVSEWEATDPTYTATQGTAGSQPTFSSAGKYVEGDGSNDELNMNAAAYALFDGLDDVSFLVVSDAPANVDTFPTFCFIGTDADSFAYIGLQSDESTLSNSRRNAASGAQAAVAAGVSATVHYRAAIQQRNTANKVIRGTDVNAAGGTIADEAMAVATSGVLLSQGGGAFASNAKVYFIGMYAGTLPDTNKAQYVADLNAYFEAHDLGITLV